MINLRRILEQMISLIRLKLMRLPDNINLHTLPTYRYGHKLTNRPTPVSSLIQQRRLKLFGHIARAAASEDHSRALRASTDRLPVLAPPKRPTSSDLASNNRQRSQTTQPWTSLCTAASNGSSFLAMHCGNGYALWACHQMMMMMDALPVAQPTVSNALTGK